ncbi:alpha/beta hydrolase family protein [Lysobacter brunescens]|uniref:Alpha/beta hydrolase family protein n=1 Tax=Lysobacter brunescens TaxID=262323 RepID=A0ABW2Y7J3_9GAMM
MGVENTGGPRASRAWRLIAALLLWALAFDVLAMREIEPGEAPELGPGEGLLAIVFDSDFYIDGARFERVDRAFSPGFIPKLQAGRTIKLYAVPAGTYRWTKITFDRGWHSYRYIDLSKDREYRFEVKPGVLGYAGDAVFRAPAGRSISVHIANRSLPLLDWLAKTHPASLERYGFAYSGMFPDPFPDFYRAALARLERVPDDLDKGLEPPMPGVLPIPAADMWRRSQTRDFALSPDGTLIAMEVRLESGGVGLDLVDVVSGTVERIFTAPLAFGTVRWESEGVLMAGIAGNGMESLHIFRVGMQPGGDRKVVHLAGPAGNIVDDTPDKPNHVLFQDYDRTGKLMVHALRLDNQESLRAFRRTSSTQRLNKGVVDDRLWFADGHERLRAALAVRGDDIVLMHGEGATFREVLRLGADNEFTPVMLSFDGDLIYGLSDEGRGQRDLVVFDPAQGRITETVFTRPGSDVHSPIFGPDRRPIGVRYYQGGRLTSEYFDPGHAALDARLSAAFPGKLVVPVNRSRDNRKFLVWVDASDSPPKLFYVDLDRKHAELVDDFYPGLAARRMVAGKSFTVKSRDGMQIEAFLTLPPGEGKRPLVVMPHGGPIGVADRLHFDPEVQFIASLGYAVLQVNFRGSEGYGRLFREAGHGEYGAGIEDDIDAAIRDVVARHPIDASRMCILGSSYGGYSALISAVRWPDRFRCAVSIAGLSDRLLFFTASDAVRSQAGRKVMIQLMGDPRERTQAFMDASPLYQYRKLTLPVMVVHGREDLRVDFEHARRLVRMLKLDGRPPVVLAFPDEGHGIDGKAALETAWTGIAGFLRKHLDDVSPTAAPAVAAPVVPAPGATPAAPGG